MDNNIWIWGYRLNGEVPGMVGFVNRPTRCSLETATAYMGADNAVFMDSTSDRNRLCDEWFAPMAGCRRVVCGLQHGFEAETAARVSEFSLSHPNVAGALIDDFLDEVGPSKDMTPAQLREIHTALKRANPALKLYVVRYSRQNMDDILEFLPWIDGISFWCWVSTEHYWCSQYHQDLVTMRRKYGKEVLQGIFVHDYGSTNGPQPMEMLQLQTPLVCQELLDGWIDGIVLLQNGWFDARDHSSQILYLKNYLDWFRGTGP